MTLDPAVARTTIEHITGAWRAQAVYAAVKLGVPDHVEAGRDTDRALAEATGADPDGLHRLMRLLVTVGVFDGKGTTGYRNTPVSAALLDRPGSLRHMCLLHGEQYYAAWAHVPETVGTRRSGFEQAFGQALYAYMGEHKDVAGRFQASLAAGNGFFASVPEVFDFDGKHVVDIGGSTGQLLSVILAAAPDAHGTLLELDGVAAAARRTLPDAVGADRVDIVAGDMFDGVPQGGDVYLLSRVFADHADESLALLFKDIRRGMRSPAARLIIFDRFVVDDDCPLLPALWDLHLLVMVGGGHRSLDGIRDLLDGAGLHVERVAELPLDHTALIVAPRP